MVSGGCRSWVVGGWYVVFPFSFISTKLISETMAFGLRNNGVLAQKQWRLTSETMAFWAQKQWRLMSETMAFALKNNGV